MNHVDSLNRGDIIDAEKAASDAEIAYDAKPEAQEIKDKIAANDAKLSDLAANKSKVADAIERHSATTVDSNSKLDKFKHDVKTTVLKVADAGVDSDIEKTTAENEQLKADYEAGKSNAGNNARDNANQINSENKTKDAILKNTVNVAGTVTGMGMGALAGALLSSKKKKPKQQIMK